MKNTKNYTFWELIKEFHIEIPIIQRDYAQGRKGNKTENIRLEFVKVLRTALLPDANKLHLNFVYGKVSNGRFVPLDGQQRLTTLFLLHWYLARASKDSIDVDENNCILKRFSYHTRPSSKDFCLALIEGELTLPSKESISKEIQDASWFFTYWEKDPTVEAMLNMLDTIEAFFERDTPEQLQEYWNKLTKERPIHFEFLDLEEFDLTDELYVKMNARGKELSPFENFKAWLMEFVAENKIEIDEKNNGWKDNLDTKWADLFWNNKGDGNYTIDEAYMNFFRNMFQVFYVKKNDVIQKENRSLSETDKIKKEEILEKARKLISNKKEDFSNDSYSSLNILDKCLSPLFKAIEVLSIHETNIKITKTELDFFRNTENSVFKGFVSNEATYADKTRFYAMLQYLLHQKGDFDKNKFLSWMRIFRNLTVNSDIGLGNFYNVLKSIDKLAKHSQAIYEHSIELLNLVGFSQAQIKEEVRKAKYIENDLIGEDVFLKFENHSYFKGRVNFLLEISGVDLVKFEDYGKKCAAIFTDKLKDGGDKAFLLERALLTIDDYLMNAGHQRWNFVKMTNNRNKKIPTWRNDFLRHKKQLSIFKILLNQLEVDKEIEGLYNAITTSKVSDWRQYIIEDVYIENISYCQQGFIKYIDDDNIWLYGSSQSNHYHAELYSSSFYEKNHQQWETGKLNIKPFKKIWYYPVKSSSDLSCAVYDDFKRDNYHYAIDIYYVNGLYHLRFYNKKPNIEDDIKNALDKIYYKARKGGGCYFYENIKTMPEVEKHLKAICATLIQFQIPTK